MGLSNKYKRAPTTSIHIARESRQRREVVLDDGFLASIARNGVINPIIVDESMTLVAGERRLAGSIKLGLPDIPIRFAGDLSPTELRIIELEENLKRSDLPWRDELRAIYDLHNAYKASDPEWTQAQTAEAVSITPGTLSMYFRVAEELDSPKIAEAQGARAAFNILARGDERAMGDALSDILEATTGVAAPKTVAKGHTDIQVPADDRPKAIPAEESILHASFLDWAPQYRGPLFNLIHCDFPYGIEVFSGSQSGKNSHTTYGDSPDVYWALIQCLGQNLDRIMAPSAHLMFWFSMRHYNNTLEAFRKWAPSLELNFMPLIWVKSDNAGILPDPKRGPRQIYETCLIASREDRPIIKAVSNAYSAPTDKSHHPSTKPEPMLRFFMQMFVDENSRVLDPTCGGGSALRAAESLGAKLVLGLEIDKEHCTNARSALRGFRALRGATK